MVKGGSCVRKLLQSQQSDDENLIEESTTAAGKTKKVIMKISIEQATNGRGMQIGSRGRECKGCSIL